MSMILFKLKQAVRNHVCTMPAKNYFGVVFISIALFNSILAKSDDLVGFWNSNGKENVVEIKKTNNENYEGRLVKITEGAVNIGFRENEQVIKNVTINEKDITFLVATRYPGSKDRSVCSPQFLTFTGKFESNNKKIKGERTSGRFEVKKDEKNKIIECLFVESEQKVNLEYIRNDTFPREKAIFKSTASGNFNAELSDSSSYSLQLSSDYDEGFATSGVFNIGQTSGGMGDGLNLIRFQVDSKRNVASYDFVTSKHTNKIPVNPKIPVPNIKSVETYFKTFTQAEQMQLVKWLGDAVLPTISAMPGGSPVVPPANANANQGQKPFIIWVNSYDNKPGGSLEIHGRFNEDHPLSVTIDGKEADVIERSASILLVKIPESARPGKRKTIVKITVDDEVLESEDKKFKILKVGEKLNAVTEFYQETVGDIIAKALRSPYLDWIIGTGHQFNQKRGRFRHSITSKEADIDGTGRGLYRWLIFIDGEFRNKYKDATFELKVSLVPKNGVKAFFNNMNALGIKSQSVAKVIIKTVNGEKVIDVKILNDKLSSALGISYNSDKKLVTLTEIFGFSLSDRNLKLNYNDDTKEISVSAENEVSKFEVKGSLDKDNDEALGVYFDQKHTTEYAELSHEMTYGLRPIAGDIGMKLTGVIKDKDGGDSAKTYLTWELGLDDRARRPGTPIPNATFKLAGHVFDDKNALGVVEFSGDILDSKLDKLQAQYTALNVPTLKRAQFGFRQSRLREMNGTSWTVFGNIKGEVDSDVEFEFGLSSELEGRFDSKRHLTNLIVKGDATLGFDVSKVKLEFGVGGQLHNIKRPEREKRYRVSGFGQAELWKIGVRVEGGYGNLHSDKESADLKLGIDLGGLWGSSAKFLKQEDKYNYNLLKKRD